jgi:anti-anti-sigma regulatory factor
MSPEWEPSGDGTPAAPANLIGPFTLSSVLVGSTAALSLAGRVDLAALPACRHAVDGLLREGATLITVDLQVAHFDDESIALLALMRRYALRHGARLALADIPPHIGRVLTRTGVGWLYRPDIAVPAVPDDGAQPPATSPSRPVHRPAKRSVSRPSASNGPAGLPTASR